MRTQGIVAQLWAGPHDGLTLDIAAPVPKAMHACSYGRLVPTEANSCAHAAHGQAEAPTYLLEAVCSRCHVASYWFSPSPGPQVTPA